MKKKSNEWKEKVIPALPLILFLLCAIQAPLDVASYFHDEYGVYMPLTPVLRMGPFLVLGLMGFWLSDHKWTYWALAGVVGVFTVLRTMALMQVEGYAFPMEDFTNLLRQAMLPGYALMFCTFIRKNDRVIRAFFAGFAVSLGIVVLVMLLSRFTGTDPTTYSDKMIGVKGWFLYGNPRSALLSMLVPMAVGWALVRYPDRVAPVAVMAVIGEGALYLFGTRLAAAAFVATGFGLGVSLLLIDRKNRWKQAAALFAVTVVLLALMPVSPMVRNQKATSENFDKRQDIFNDVVQEEEGLEGEEEEELLGEIEWSSEEEKIKVLTKAYNNIMPRMMIRFDAKEILELYNYSTDVNYVAGQRLMRRNYCELLQRHSPKSAKWFGMDVSRMRVSDEEAKINPASKTWDRVKVFVPENDFHAVYYLYGAVGLALMVAFLAYFAVRGLYALARDFKRYFTVEFAATAICCCIDLVHCIFTASILGFINVSIYMAMTLAILWRLSRRELSPKRMKTETK